MPTGNKKNHKSSKPHKGKAKTGKEDRPGVAFSTKGIEKKKAETTAVGSRRLEEVVWEGCGDERINLPPINGHTGVFAYHMDDCLCNMGGWPCFRDGSLWSCCGSTDLHSYCEKAPVKKIKPKNRKVKNIVESSSSSSEEEIGKSEAGKQNKESGTSGSGEFSETKEGKKYETKETKGSETSKSEGKEEKQGKPSGTIGCKKSGTSESGIKESKESKTDESGKKETKRSEKAKKSKGKQKQTHPTRINIVWEVATKVSNLPPIRGHTGVFALHMDDCLCGMGGWPCYRDGYIWSCCGSTDENSHCSKSGKK